MKLIPFDEVGFEAWNQLCDGSDDAWMFHRYEWVKIEQKRFVLENLSFAIAENDKLTALFPLYLSDATTGAADEILLHCGIHRHTGLAIRNGVELPKRKAIQRFAMHHVLEVANEVKAERIQLNVQNLAPARLGIELPFWVSDWKFYYGLGFGPNGIVPAPGLNTCCADQIVDLHPDEDEIFSRFAEACRRAVRKAQKFELSATAEPIDTAISTYYDLALKSATRTGENLPKGSYFEDLAAEFFGITDIVIVRTKDGKPAAAMLLPLYKGAASFQAGVSDPAHLDKRVNDFLHWSAIRHAKAKGAVRYRLGPIFPQVPADWPIAKVSKFKGKFGGKSVEIAQGSLFLNKEKYLSNLKLMADNFSGGGPSKKAAAAVRPIGSVLRRVVSLVKG